jgi:hypothetical protein
VEAWRTCEESLVLRFFFEGSEAVVVVGEVGAAGCVLSVSCKMCLESGRGAIVSSWCCGEVESWAVGDNGRREVLAGLGSVFWG